MCKYLSYTWISIAHSPEIIHSLISGLSPASVVEDIGPRITDLEVAINQASLQDGSLAGKHRQQIEETARSVLLRAPELVSTGLLSGGDESTRAASKNILRDVIADHEKSLQMRNDRGKQNQEQAGDTDTDSDSDDGLEQSLRAQLFAQGEKSFEEGKFEIAETYIRNGLRHIPNITANSGQFDITGVRLTLARCCMCRDKLEEAELMFLILARGQAISDDHRLQAYHSLAQVYLCLYDFESALEYSSLAAKGRRKTFGKQDERYWSSQQLLALVFRANGDVVTSTAYAQKVPQPSSNTENQIIIDRFSGYSSQGNLQLSLGEKKEALKQLAEADFLAARRPDVLNAYNRQRQVNFVLGADALNLQKALLWAAGENKLLAVKWLLAQGADATGSLDTYPLVAAAYGGYAAVAELLLESGAEVDATGDGHTPLTWASILGHESTVRVLLKHHAKVNGDDSSRDAPLADAACKGHTSIMKLLLDKGADVNARNRHGKTALMMSLTNNQPDAAEYLIKHAPEIDLDACNAAGQSTLAKVIQARSPRLLRLLLDDGVEERARRRAMRRGEKEDSDSCVL